MIYSMYQANVIARLAERAEQESVPSALTVYTLYAHYKYTFYNICMPYSKHYVHCRYTVCQLYVHLMYIVYKQNVWLLQHTVVCSYCKTSTPQREMAEEDDGLDFTLKNYKKFQNTRIVKFIFDS